MGSRVPESRGHGRHVWLRRQNSSSSGVPFDLEGIAKLSSTLRDNLRVRRVTVLVRPPSSPPPLASVHTSLTASQCHLSTDWIPQVQRASISFVVPWIWLDISYNPLLSTVQHYSLATPVLERSAPTTFPLLSANRLEATNHDISRRDRSLRGFVSPPIVSSALVTSCPCPRSKKWERRFGRRCRERLGQWRQYEAKTVW